ncbi:hypothetical protein [Sinomonas sp. ASV322]|uniref:hypothetical protein n=1 Tax=Sinomonas sp. ASV322 TaxID=3041920 RepID=UPI0027DBA0FC|nr:hypothetical protein [Sinomonas sp. ASV322]MDQ4502354.1 hypothetical protein [Sinomonas sp. ASV322]
MTAQTVVAYQGIWLDVEGNTTIPPTYWDVESTLWLNWRFRGARLTEEITSPVGPPKY